jgi:hypothetical protein
LPTFTVSQAAERTGWSPRMLRYLESTGLVVPARSASGYRRYGDHDLELLRGSPSCAAVRRRARRRGVRRPAAARPEAADRVEAWLDGATVPAEGASEADWIAWEQRKHEQLLVA